MRILLFSLTICLLFSLALSLIVIDGDNAITRFDHDAVTTLREHTTPSGINRFKIITWFGSPALWIISPACGVYLLLRRQWANLLTGVAVIGGGKILNTLLKDLFDRPRPVWPEEFAHEGAPAFPSGHAMFSLLAYGFILFLVWQSVKNPPARAVLLFGTVTFISLIGFSRLYLGVHYPTDVLGGYAMGGAWLSLCLLGRIMGDTSFREERV